jgi:hypothetical protein
MEYKGYIVTQSKFNNHIMICKDGSMVAHINCVKPMNEPELQEVVENYLKWRKGN